MRVHIATDHAAFEVKQYLVQELGALGYEIIDHGAHSYDANDDYPDFCIPCAEAVVRDPGSLGIVLGGSGNGEQMAANKVRGIRAGLAYNPELARLTREHNDANILSLGARMQSQSELLAIATTFLTTPYSNDPRHQRRIDKLSTYENDADQSGADR
jgi:ribose 5-phosphate isomerase B